MDANKGGADPIKVLTTKENDKSKETDPNVNQPKENETESRDKDQLETLKAAIEEKNAQIKKKSETLKAHKSFMEQHN